MLAHFLLKYIVAYQFVQLHIALFVIYHNLPFAIFTIDYFEGKIYIYIYSFRINLFLSDTH